MTSHDGALSALTTGVEGDVPMERWPRPDRVTVEGSSLLIEPPFAQTGRCGPGMLLGFMRLKSATDVQRYAAKWGHLGMCAIHPTEPLSHGPRPVAIRDLVAPTCGQTSLAEPISVWLYYASRFHGLYRLAQTLRSPAARPVTGVDFVDFIHDRLSIGRETIFAAFPELEETARQLGPHPSPKRFILFPFGIEAYLAQSIASLLEQTRTGIGFDWWNGSLPRLVFGSTMPTLLGALALQLAFSIAGEPETFLCSTCGRSFEPPEQGVRRGFRQYCQSCRENGAPQREASKRYRARLKEERRDQ